MKLQLDFEKTSLPDRQAVVDSELARFEEAGKKLSDRDIRNIADYLLWANKGEESKAAGINLNTTWSEKEPVSSLDKLKEDNPTIDNLIKDTPTRYIVNKKPFDRQKALERYPEKADQLRYLFREIDKLALALGDPKSEKLNKRIREFYAAEELPKVFEQIEQMRQKFADQPYLKLKQRKYLIELRTEQYDLAPPDGNGHESALVHPAMHSSFNEKRENFGVFPEISVEALPQSADLADFLDLYTNEDLGRFTIQKKPEKNDNMVDLTDREQIIQTIMNWGTIQEFSDRAIVTHQIHNGFPGLLKIASFFIWGGLKGFMNPSQVFILHEKMEGKQNDIIRRSLVNHGGHDYQTNYISTIFRQRAVDNIWKFVNLYIETNNAAAVKEYEKFKQCKKCGRLLIKHKETFPTSGKSADGYGDTCKFCKNFKKNLKDKIDFDFEGFEEEFYNEFNRK